MLLKFAILAAGTTMWMACSSSSPQACAEGSMGCNCYGNGTCNGGLACNSDFTCEPGTVEDASSVRDTGSENDGSPNEHAPEAGDEAPEAGDEAPEAGDDSSKVDESGEAAPAPDQCKQFPINISEDTTIPPGCYEVRVVPSMAESVDLTLSAGVTLFFSDGTWLEAGEGGSITALGTSVEPVVFTSHSRQPGAWGGVLIPDGDLLLVNVVVEYAGGTIPGAERYPCVPNINAGVRCGYGNTVAVSSSTFRHNLGAGVGFEDECSYVIEFDDNTLSNNDLPLATGADGIFWLGARNDLTGNATDHVELLHGGVYSNATWIDLGVPIFAPEGMIVEGAMVLSAGVTIRFAPGTELVVEGSFRTAGTTDNPVALESAVPGESWQGITCVDDGSVDLVGAELIDASAMHCD